MKKRILFLAVTAAIMIVSSCSKEPVKNTKIAVFLPISETNARWNSDIKYLPEALDSMNLDYTLYLAADETGAKKQVAQIFSAIDAGVKTLIITPIDFDEINSSKVLEERGDLNVICHDRMLYNSKEVDFYSACDNVEVGSQQASFLVQALAMSGKTSMTLEMLAGPASDNNSISFFEGAWQVLEPYVENGSLKVVSGKKSYADVAMDKWAIAAAESAMTQRLSTYYPDGGVPDLILAPNDISAIGTVQAIEKHCPSISAYPVITAQDNTEKARELIAKGKISMTIDKSIKAMAYNTANVANMLMNGLIPAAPSTFDNGVKSVPFMTSAPKVITQGNL